MDPGLWNREKDDMTTTTTPEAVPSKTARRDFREMGMNEEARPAGEWADLRQPADGKRRSARLRAKGKEPVRPSIQANEVDHGRHPHSPDVDTATGSMPVMCRAPAKDRSKTTSGSDMSTRSAGSESTVAPDSSENLLEKQGSDDEAGETIKTTSGTSGSSESAGQRCTPSAQPKRQSVFAGARKGIAQYFPAKKKKPQY